MKNIPKKIYLQIGDECPDDADFKDLSEVCWCADKIFENDIEFVLKKGMIKINEVLTILQENYQTSKKIEDKSKREILIETYEDLIHIFNHKRNLVE